LLQLQSIEYPLVIVEGGIEVHSNTIAFKKTLKVCHRNSIEMKGNASVLLFNIEIASNKKDRSDGEVRPISFDRPIRIQTKYIIFLYAKFCSLRVPGICKEVS
jgi:hypothetical protein